MILSKTNTCRRIASAFLVAMHICCFSSVEAKARRRLSTATVMPSFVLSPAPSTSLTDHPSSTPSSATITNVPSNAPTGVPSDQAFTVIDSLSLSTTATNEFAGNGAMFFVKATSTKIRITTIGFYTEHVSQNQLVEVFSRPGKYEGHEVNSTGWTQIHSGTIDLLGLDVLTHLFDINVDITFGDYQSFFLWSPNQKIVYTVGTNEEELYSSNTYIDFYEGVGIMEKFTGDNDDVKSPRVLRGMLGFEVLPTNVPSSSPTLPLAAPTAQLTAQQMQPLNTVGNDGSPPEFYPLGLCEGDCDNDDECAGDLICHQRGRNEAVPGCAGGENEGEPTDFCILPDTTPTPSESPSTHPTSNPNSSPSESPSAAPSPSPSVAPSNSPSVKPSIQPTIKPSLDPSVSPTASPSDVQSLIQSAGPSQSPSAGPSASPSSEPSISPSSEPTSKPSSSPSDVPSKSPSGAPSASPSSGPSKAPSTQPTSKPSSSTSSSPSYGPSLSLSSEPSSQPSGPPSKSSPSPATVIMISSSMKISDFDQSVCEDNQNDFSNAFTAAIEQVVSHSLDTDQQMLDITVTSIVCDTGRRKRTLNRMLESGSATVEYDLIVRETCPSCDANSTVAENLYAQVKKTLSEEIANGNFASAIQEENNSALSSAFAGSVDAGNFDYEMMESQNTTSPSATPVDVIQSVPLTPKPTPTSAGKSVKILTSGLTIVLLSLLL